jgi:uncharacterized protein
MKLLIVTAIVIIALYLMLIIVLYVLQARLIFYPAPLPGRFRFNLGNNGQECFLQTTDGERINALFFKGHRPEVILYFHGNAGNLSGWQFVAEDFTTPGYNLMIIDYRGYGKSTGSVSEHGLYNDAEAAYHFLLNDKGFKPSDIIIYGRSIGTGPAIQLASTYPCRGMVLEAPYVSLAKLANEKLPFLFPSFYLRFRFSNIQKINNVKNPVVFIHGDNDTLIPASHTEALYKKFTGPKKKVIVRGGSHNDLNSFPEYNAFLEGVLPSFFDPEEKI